MSESEFISVQKFAELAGVSRQTVYKRLSTDLQKYVKFVNGKKVISNKALKIFNVNLEDDKCKPVDKEMSISVNDLSTILQEQLKAKDEQIKSLESQLNIKDLQIAEMNERLKESLKLNENNQILLLGKTTEQKQVIEVIKTPIKKSWWQRLKGE